MRTFSMQHRFFNLKPEIFTELNAPHWLKYGGKEESTMCNRWFWKDYIMKLKVGEARDTDFQAITRIA